MPPAPISWRTSYGPRRTPDSSGMGRSWPVNYTVNDSVLPVIHKSVEKQELSRDSPRTPGTLLPYLATAPSSRRRNAMSKTPRLGAHRTARLTVAVLVTCLPILAGPAAKADDLCGATIVADLTLDHDLTCAGDGIIIGADGIAIDLNGYTITGPGTGVGIAVTGRADVSIAGGIIRTFTTAVRVNASTDVVIKQIEFVENSEAIDLQSGSVGNTIKDSLFRDSTTRAIMLRGNSIDNDIKNNTFIGNRVGILLFGSVDTTVKQNVISGSSVAGIRLNVIATGNVLKDNTVRSN